MSLLAPAVSYTVHAYEPGAQVVSVAGTPSTFTVRAGHGFAAGDKFLLKPGTTNTFSGTDVVASVTATTVVMTSGTYTAAAGDYLANLGNDTGTASPNFDGNALVTIYSDMGATQAIASSALTTNSDGEYFYWHNGPRIWELIRTGSTVVAMLPDAVVPAEMVRYANQWATAGAGTSASPWTGWDYAATSFGGRLHFPAGYYSTAGVTMTVTSGTQGPTISGDGPNETFIRVSADAPALKITSSGGSPNAIKGLSLHGITFQAGTAITNYLVELDYLDLCWSVRDIRCSTNGNAVGTALYLLDCQNGLVDNLTIRGDFSSGTDKFAVGVLIHADDANQRGNINFVGGVFSNCNTCVSFTSVLNSLNNCSFVGTKFVNSSTYTVAGTVGASLNGQADQASFVNCHFEKMETGISNSSADGMQVIGGIFSQCKNAGDTDGSCIDISGAADGCVISGARFNNSYDGLQISGTSTRILYSRGRVDSITNAEYTDSSSGANFRINGNDISTALTVSGHLTGSAGLGVGANTLLTIATGAVTATKSFHTIDTEGAAASDDLDTISGLNDGDLLVVRAVADARTVVAKNGTGNLFLAGADFSMDNSKDALTLIKAGSNWLELSRSDNGA